MHERERVAHDGKTHIELAREAAKDPNMKDVGAGFAFGYLCGITDGCRCSVKETNSSDR